MCGNLYTNEQMFGFSAKERVTVMLGERIKKLRVGASMTQQELAVKLKVSPSSVGMYEQNRRVPPNEVLLRICECFQVSSDWLLSGETSLLRQRTVYNDAQEDLTAVLDSLKIRLKEQEGLMFHGEILNDEDIEKIFDAMKLGAEIAVIKHKK